jgi:tRNA 2-selenouridine synthase
VVEDRAALDAALARLPTYPGRKRLEDWGRLADAGAFEELAAALIELHYDPAYRRSSRKDARPRLATIEMSGVGPAELAAAADRVAGLISTAAAAGPMQDRKTVVHSGV